MTSELLKCLAAVAAKRSDGHVTIMKFTTNWRVAFYTPITRRHRAYAGRPIVRGGGHKGVRRSVLAKVA
jgi:hypothetical protein